MAHKGRRYPVSIPGRLYSGDWFWPNFLAEKYDIICNYINGTPSPILFSAAGCDASGWAIGDGTIQWFGAAAAYGGQSVELRLIADIVTWFPLWGIYGQMIWGGVPQVTPHQAGAQFLEGFQIDDVTDASNNSFPPIAGNGYCFFSARRVPW